MGKNNQINSAQEARFLFCKNVNEANRPPAMIEAQRALFNESFYDNLKRESFLKALTHGTPKK